MVAFSLGVPSSFLPPGAPDHACNPGRFNGRGSHRDHAIASGFEIAVRCRDTEGAAVGRPSFLLMKHGDAACAITAACACCDPTA